MAKKAVLQQYLRRQTNDEFCKKAREHDYRARSAFKLIELNQKHHIVKPDSVVVDLGAAPGSWCQVLSELLSPGENQTSYVLGVDLQFIRPIPGVHLLSLSDITKRTTQNNIKQCLQNRKVDAILSDMAPNPCGDSNVDHERIIDLCKKALSLFCSDFPTIPLKKGGVFLCKIWDGPKKGCIYKISTRTF